MENLENFDALSAIQQTAKSASEHDSHSSHDHHDQHHKQHHHSTHSHGENNLGAILRSRTAKRSSSTEYHQHHLHRCQYSRTFDAAGAGLLHLWLQSQSTNKDDLATTTASIIEAGLMDVTQHEVSCDHVVLIMLRTYLCNYIVQQSSIEHVFLR
jgi:hypothetical protein